MRGFPLCCACTQGVPPLTLCALQYCIQVGPTGSAAVEPSPRDEPLILVDPTWVKMPDFFTPLAARQVSVGWMINTSLPSWQHSLAWQLVRLDELPAWLPVDDKGLAEELVPPPLPRTPHITHSRSKAAQHAFCALPGPESLTLRPTPTFAGSVAARPDHHPRHTRHCSPSVAAGHVCIALLAQAAVQAAG